MSSVLMSGNKWPIVVVKKMKNDGHFLAVLSVFFKTQMATRLVDGVHSLVGLADTIVQLKLVNTASDKRWGCWPINLSGRKHRIAGTVHLSHSVYPLSYMAMEKVESISIASKRICFLFGFLLTTIYVVILFDRLLKRKRTPTIRMALSGVSLRRVSRDGLKDDLESSSCKNKRVARQIDREKEEEKK